MEELDVILEYRRKEPCWVCAECDSENGFGNGNCLFCGRARSNTDYVIKEWTEQQNTVSVGFGGARGTTGTTGASGEKNPYTVWLVIGAIVLFILFVAAVSSNACEVETVSCISDGACSILESGEQLLL